MDGTEVQSVADTGDAVEAMATDETLGNLLWSMVDENFIYVVGAFVVAWLASIGAAQSLKGFMDDNDPKWVLKVRAIAFGIATIFCGLLLSLVFSDNEAWTKFVLISVMSLTCGFMAPLVFDPCIKRFLWPMILRPILGIVFKRFGGDAPASPPPPPGGGT